MSNDIPLYQLTQKHISQPTLKQGIDMGLIDEKMRTPLYHQVYLVLRDSILSGDIGFQSIIASEQETSARFGVSRITAKRALNELAAEGLVVRERGRGTRVIYQPPSVTVHGGIDGLMDNLLSMAKATQVRVKAFDYIKADAEVARALRCDKGNLVQRALRVRSLDDEPFSHLTTFVPEAIGRNFDHEDLAKTPLLSLLEGAGISIGKAEQTISASLSDVDVSTALGLEFGSPLLNIRRVVFDAQNQPVEYIRALYRPDRYQYSMALSRIGEEHSRSWATAEG